MIWKYMIGYGKMRGYEKMIYNDMKNDRIWWNEIIWNEINWCEGNGFQFVPWVGIGLTGHKCLRAPQLALRVTNVFIAPFRHPQTARPRSASIEFFRLPPHAPFGFHKPCRAPASPSPVGQSGPVGQLEHLFEDSQMTIFWGASLKMTPNSSQKGPKMNPQILKWTQSDSKMTPKTFPNAPKMI